MQVTKIRVQSKLETEPLFPELVGKPVMPAELKMMGVLEGGMQSGNTSVALFATLKDGTHVMVQMSAQNLYTLGVAAKAGAERFGEIFS